MRRPQKSSTKFLLKLIQFHGHTACWRKSATRRQRCVLELLHACARSRTCPVHCICRDYCAAADSSVNNNPPRRSALLLLALLFRSLSCRLRFPAPYIAAVAARKFSSRFRREQGVVNRLIQLYFGDPHCRSACLGITNRRASSFSPCQTCRWRVAALLCLLFIL